LSEFSGQTRAELATTARGAPSYEFGAAGGGPLIPDRLGFRASGWYRVDGGYIDRVHPFTGTLVDDDANSLVRKSARLALTWALTDSVRVTPALIFQSSDADDVSSFVVALSDPEDGELNNGNQIAQPWSDELELASVRVTAGENSLEFRSLTSYYHQDSAVIVDVSGIEVYNPTPGIANLSQKVFSQELALSSQEADTRFRWSAGIGYWDRRIHETSWAGNHQEGSDSETVSDYATLAAYGELAFDFNDRLTASAGLRIARADYEADTRIEPRTHVENRDDYAAPDFGLTYEVDAQRSVYLTAARGYRAGGVYAPVFGCGNLDGPVPYPADDLWSYELGTKHSGIFDGRLDLDASAFHIQWSHSEEPPNVGCIALSYLPPSAAASHGISFASRLFLNDQLRLGLSVAYTDGHYTKTIDPLTRDGDPLSVPPWVVTASIERDFLLAEAMISARADYTYRYMNQGPEPTTRMLNLRAVLARKRLEASLFIANALDSQPTFGIAHVCCDDPFFTASTFRPRTVGLSATWRL
jgi:outer membrane receptor protein involved in Fe transport